MPWVKQEVCNGCGNCVEECPVYAISIKYDLKAHIDMESCIRCGKCHDICPQKAIKHDSEEIPLNVKANIEKTRRMMRHFKSKEERRRCLKRMINHFENEKVVAERTSQKLKVLNEHMHKC
ncbi:MAG: 4Fe-4S binding protein [Deltaproteobacteria bacterium]|nr:4Fe-4S binding protein [Deltaproteobacteria bacterium]